MYDAWTRAPDTFSWNVQHHPSHDLQRKISEWKGIKAESIQITRHDRFECSFRAPWHLLMVAEQAERTEGETLLEGVPKSSLRNFSRKMTFVPAGHRFHGWNKLRVPVRITYFYIDPRGPLLDPELRFAETEFKPQLYFFDQALWDTALKLKARIEEATPGSRQYAEALSVALAHELVRVNNSLIPSQPIARGGLAGWQRKRVAEYIDQNLSEDISLSTLAELANLSPYHFSRVFKHSFGVPPHRYHTMRRIERAKTLLGNPAITVTEVAMKVGFRAGSSLTSAFRRWTGQTPNDFRRSLE